jgi:hypothetical protein
MKIRLNEDSGKKDLSIHGVGSFKLGETYDIDSKIAKPLLERTIKTRNPLNPEKILDVPIFVEVAEPKKEEAEPAESKKGGK